jgi:predicted MFS family arabinose efflux permease
MIWCDIGRGITVLSVPIALAFDALSIWQVYLVCLVEGSLFVFFNIAEVAVLRKVAPAAQLQQATAQNEAAFGAVHIAGPSIGTTLLQSFGRGGPFVANFVCYVASVICLMLNRGDFRASAQQRPLALRQEVTVGLRWLWGRPLIRFLAFLTGGLNFLDAAVPLILIVSAKQLGATDVQVGMIFSVGGVGAIVGSIVGGSVQRYASFRVVIVGAVWFQFFLFPLYATAPSSAALAIIYGLACFSLPIFNVVQFSYRIRLIPDSLQGRVNSTFRLLAFGLHPLGAALSGVLLERYGVGPTVAILTGWVLLLAVSTTLSAHIRNTPRLGAESGAGLA